MAISPALIEEFIADTRALAQSIAQYGDRWCTYGAELENRMSESQREEVKRHLDDLSAAVEQLGEGRAAAGGDV